MSSVLLLELLCVGLLQGDKKTMVVHVPISSLDPLFMTGSIRLHLCKSLRVLGI